MFLLWCLCHPASSSKVNTAAFHLDARIISSATAYLESTYSSFSEKKKCALCFMYASLCVCSKAAELRSRYSSLLNIQDHLQVSVLMHYKELGRPSNTGKLLPMIFPNFSSIAVYGSETSMKSVDYLLENRAIILFPEAGAGELTASSFDQIYGKADLDTEEVAWLDTNSRQRRRRKEDVLVVIDATWREAKTINKWLPRNIPRLRLPSPPPPTETILNTNGYIDQNSSASSSSSSLSACSSPVSVYLTRKRAIIGTEGVSTFSSIEAVAQSLDILHEQSRDALNTHGMSFSSLFTELLKYCVDAVLKQRGSKEAFGSNVVPNLSPSSGYKEECTDSPATPSYAQEHQGPFTPATVKRPEQCPSCGGVVRFKNLGGTLSEGASGVFRRKWRCGGCSSVFTIESLNGSELSDGYL